MEIKLLGACASDLDVVNAARVSFANHHKEMEEGDDKLIGFLLRNRHGTPFEHGYFRFWVEAPIFVFREWHRHRVGHSYNEMSARYTEMPEDFYVPGLVDERPGRSFPFRTQHGKPGAYTFEDSETTPELEIARHAIQDHCRAAFDLYRSLLRVGVAKEQARTVLPVGMYSQMYWSVNPRSLMHFLGLRTAPQALREIRYLAEGAEKALATFMPATWAAFVENGRVAP